MTIRIKCLSPVVKRVRHARPSRLGSPSSYDFIHNCISCSKWPYCLDTSKGVSYRCTRYREATIDSTSLEEVLKETAANTEVETIFTPKSGSEQDIQEMIEAVIASNVPVPPDLRINDEEIPVAKNFDEWATDDRFAGGGVPPFPRQLELGTKLFAEYCPRCSDEDWFSEMPVDAPLSLVREKVVFLENGVCPACRVTKTELVGEGELLDYTEIVLVSGQRSGKSASTNLWDGYNLHRFLKLANPATVYGLLPSQILISTPTALTFAQAVTNLWNPFRNILTSTPWFINLHEFLSRRGDELGDELFHLSELSIRYRHRNLFIAPSGPSKRTLRGATRVSTSCDEIGWFPVARKGTKNGSAAEYERLDAKGVYHALKNSLFTVKSAYKRRLEEGYSSLPKPIMYLISSPSAYNDFIMSSYRKAYGSSEVLRGLYPTWDFNPLLKKSDFADNFRSDPVAAERDFACNPPIGESLFINDIEIAAKCFSKRRSNGMNVKTSVGLSKTKQRVTMSSVTVPTSKRPKHGTVLSIDVGLVSNSFAFTVVGLPDDYSQGNDMDGRDTQLTPVKVWACGEVMPKGDARISLNSLYHECLIPLVEEYNCLYLISDRWQNASIGSALEEAYEVAPIELRAKWNDFDNTRELLYSGEIELPRLTAPVQDIIETTLDEYPECFRRRPVDHLLWQFATVREQTNVTVLKGDGGTDDLFRTVVLAVSLLQDDDVIEYLMESKSSGIEVADTIGLLRRVGESQQTAVSAGVASDGLAIGIKRGMAGDQT